MLAVIGHQVACAELGNRQFSGRAAWLLWRAVYLSKLPGTAQKVRVLVDWVAELFFPRDIVQTLDAGPRRAREGPETPGPRGTSGRDRTRPSPGSEADGERESDAASRSSGGSS